MMAILAVAVIAVAGVSAGAYIVLTQDHYDDTADGMAKKICDKYSGVYGEFKIEEGATAEKAVINSVVEQYLNNPGAGNSSNRLTILKFETKEAAEAKYTELLASFPSKLGMYTALDTIELTADNGAKDYNCDKGKLMFATYDKKTAEKGACQTAGLILHGKYVIDFSHTVGQDAEPGENVRLYYGIPVSDKFEAGQQISLDTLKGEVQKFLKVL